MLHFPLDDFIQRLDTLYIQHLRISNNGEAQGKLLQQSCSRILLTVTLERGLSPTWGKSPQRKRAEMLRFIRPLLPRLCIVKSSLRGAPWKLRRLKTFSTAVHKDTFTSVGDIAAGLREGLFSRVVVMSGAGVSTASGIPDFRCVWREDGECMGGDAAKRVVLTSSSRTK